MADRGNSPRTLANLRPHERSSRNQAPRKPAPKDAWQSRRFLRLEASLDSNVPTAVPTWKRYSDTGAPQVSIPRLRGCSSTSRYLAEIRVQLQRPWPTLGVRNTIFPRHTPF